jgi:hypothetical protein
MKAITGDVEMLLDGLEEGPRRGGALLASELIAGASAGVPRETSGPRSRLRLEEESPK